MHGKVTRGILEDRFGPSLLTTLEAFNRRSITDDTAGETKGYYSERLDALCGTEATSGELQVLLLLPAQQVFGAFSRFDSGLPYVYAIQECLPRY